MGIGMTLALLSMTAACRLPWTKEEPKPIPESTRLWSHSGPHPIGSVVNVEGIAIGTATFERELVVLAFDPKTGKKLWQRKASNGNDYLERGRGMAQKIGKYVAFLRPAKDYPESAGMARVVVVDPKTGKDKFSTPELFVYSDLYPCRTSANVCFKADKEINEDEPQELELSVTTGKLAPAS
ncbi:MAG: hypothetical protein ACRC0L_12955, partial [Angustibacter sp.]